MKGRPAVTWPAEILPTLSWGLPLAACLSLSFGACIPGAATESPEPLVHECVPTLPQPGEVSDPYRTVVEEFEMESPAGDRIYGMIRRPDPDLYPDLCFATLAVRAVIEMAGME